jgi:hypothetical protein
MAKRSGVDREPCLERIIFSTRESKPLKQTDRKEGTEID